MRRALWPSALSLTLVSFVSSTWSRGFDLNAFQHLPADRRLAVVLASFDWRERQLENFSYQLTETVHAEDGKLLTRSRFDFRRLGAANLLHCIRLEMLPGLRPSEFWCEWDGQVARTRTEKQGQSYGTVTDGESEFVHRLYYNDLLGVRISMAPMTLAAWVRFRVGVGHRPFVVDATADGGTVLIRLRVETVPNAWDTYSVEPNRDYMIVRHEWEGIYSKLNDKGHMVHRVIEASRESGLWVPTKTEEIYMLRESNGRKATYVYSVETFKRGVVQITDLALEFPVGTTVLDTIQKTRYEVEEGGRVRRGEYYDSLIGQVFGPDGRILKRPTTRPSTRPALAGGPEK